MIGKERARGKDKQNKDGVTKRCRQTVREKEKEEYKDKNKPIYRLGVR